MSWVRRKESVPSNLATGLHVACMQEKLAAHSSQTAVKVRRTDADLDAAAQVQDLQVRAALRQVSQARSRDALAPAQVELPQAPARMRSGISPCASHQPNIWSFNCR